MRSHGLTISQIHTGGVSIADLLSAGLTIPQLNTGGVPDQALFSEACGTPETRGPDSVDSGPRITLTGGTPLSATVTIRDRRTRSTSIQLCPGS